MDDANEQVKEEEEMKENTVGKIYVKQLHQILEDPSSKSTSDEVQRAIKGLKEIPDEELKEFLDDEAFLAGLDVVDAWERDEDKNFENKQDTTRSTKQGENQLSREHHRPEPKGSNRHKKAKREEKKREEIRRDPLKSTKDIERDKMRTKRDTENKLLAEKEKAIKYLLDSDNVVPPGTETEAILSIAEEQNKERAQREAQRNKEHRKSKSLERYGRPARRTPDRSRLSPYRRKSPFVSPDRRRSPFKTSAERHRSPYKYSPSRRKNSPRPYDRRSPVLSPDRRRSPRRLSGERRSSVDRRWSAERRGRRRADWTHERRRSRSRDRRSRSTERLRRRSSRSPVSRRYSPRRRSRTRTRSRSPEKRIRKRSPFINELARQLRNEAMSTGMKTGGYVSPATMEGIAPLLNPSTYKQEVEPMPPPPAQPPPPPPPPPSVVPPFVHQPGPLPPPTPSSSSMLPPMPSGSPFINFDPAATLMNFESMPPPHTPTPANYSSGPVMYNQPNTIQAPPPSAMCSPLLPISSPQPVPPPVMDHAHVSYNPSYTVPFVQPSPVRQFETPNKSLNHSTAPSTSSQSYKEHGLSASSYKEVYSPHQERVKTPEPPIISKPKQKTSLSSLLEASVSAKGANSSNIPVLYPGFKPEIMRHCEQALYQLPIEDPRLKMKGRFFYDRSEENVTKDVSEDHTSNSILLQTSKTKIFWKESNAEQPISVPKAATQMHQKICQTDEVETETKGVQASVTMVDFESQVYPHDLQQVKEEKRPIMDRLDWSARDTYEYGSKFREVEDLRWSLSNSSQRRSWNRQTSPSRRSDEHEQHLDSADHESRSLRLDSPIRNRDDFSTHSNTRDHYSHDRYSPDYHRRSIERDEFHDRRSDHSRGESPMELEESDDEFNSMTGHTFQRGSDWHGRGKVLKGKSHNLRGKHAGGRPYRSRGNFRG